MQDQSNLKTPSRGVGLRRISSASKSNTTSTSAVASKTPGGSDGTPKSMKDQKTENVIPVNSHPQRRFSDGTVLPESSDNSYPFVKSLSADQLTNIRCKPIHKRLLNLLETPEDGDSQSVSKKPKVSSQPTLEDLDAIRRRVSLKERQLEELRRAQVICNKHDPEKLKKDIQHWLQACQEALRELLSAVVSRGGTLDMRKLLEELGIPSSLVHFNIDSEDFD